MFSKSPLALVAWVLVLIGALNWGLIGVSYFMSQNWNVVTILLGSWPQVEAVVYILVGLSALYSLVTCKSKSGSM